MTIKTRETCVHISYYEYLRVFTKLFTGTQVSDDFQFRYPVPEITENAQPYFILLELYM